MGACGDLHALSGGRTRKRMLRRVLRSRPFLRCAERRGASFTELPRLRRPCTRSRWRTGDAGAATERVRMPLEVTCLLRSSFHRPEPLLDSACANCQLISRCCINLVVTIHVGTLKGHSEVVARAWLSFTVRAGVQSARRGAAALYSSGPACRLLMNNVNEWWSELRHTPARPQRMAASSGGRSGGGGSQPGATLMLVATVAALTLATLKVRLVKAQ